MKLVGDLAKRAEKAETKEDLKEVINDAGIELDDKELDSVSGGLIPTKKKPSPDCGELVGGHL